MSNRNVSALSHRSFSRTWSSLLHRIISSAAFRSDPHGLLESLEDRTLLSASGMNYTDVVIYRPGDYLQPAILGAASGTSPAQMRAAYGIAGTAMTAVVQTKTSPASSFEARESSHLTMTGRESCHGLRCAPPPRI